MFGSACACWLIVFMGVVALAGISAAIRSAVRNRGLTPGEFHCPRCRYNLRGITKPACPECGCNLLISGVRTVNDQPPVGLATRLAAWSAFLVGPAMFVAALADSGADQVARRTRQTWTAQAENPSGSLFVRMSSDEFGSGARPASLRVVLSRRDPPVVAFEIDLRHPPEAAHLAKRVEALGPIDPAIDVEEVGRDLAVMVHAAGTRRHVVSTDMGVLRGNSQITAHDSTDDSLRTVLFAAPMILVVAGWIGGCVWISRDYERVMRKHKKRMHGTLDFFFRNVEAAAKASAADEQP